MQGESSELSACPSFNSYSSDRLAAIAAEVTREFDGVGDRQRQLGDDYRGEEPEDNDDDFEFVSVRRADDVAVIDGHVGPVFPIFNRDLFAEKSKQKINETCDPEEAEGHDVPSVRVPLKQLLVEERDQTSSTFSTSSEEEVEDGLDGVPPGTYCIWTPNSSNNSSSKASPSKCKKSSSTGTGPASASKRWRLSSFLRRCNSEGKESLVFLTPKKEAEIRAEKAAELDYSKLEKKVLKKAVSKETMSSAHEAFYVRNRAMREGDKRRTYLPYRQDLVGFWTSVGALGKTFPPF
ncbi:uncharacterized protein LOC121251123 [Juglans microcarpa x Juglans regia]|uniref:uncharacterized protein LOC121251123 n=1 Tax=Juglans microcarpa x Juglans regia TaxID=2249226 RepID=UPI001B7E0ED8|nr:uncharacterized protein LOC121251123 [Juglans microcarpa x Juglans regia]